MFGVLVIDTMMLRNLFFYNPFECGQYTDPEDHIWTVLEPEELPGGFYKGYSWEERRGCCGDTRVEARYTGASSAMKAVALLPCIVLVGMVFHMVKTGLGKQFCHKKKEDPAASAPNEVAEHDESHVGVSGGPLSPPLSSISQMLSPRVRTYSKLVPHLWKHDESPRNNHTEEGVVTEIDAMAVVVVPDKDHDEIEGSPAESGQAGVDREAGAVGTVEGKVAIDDGAGGGAMAPRQAIVSSDAHDMLSEKRSEFL